VKVFTPTSNKFFYFDANHNLEDLILANAVDHGNQERAGNTRKL